MFLRPASGIGMSRIALTFLCFIPIVNPNPACASLIVPNDSYFANIWISGTTTDIFDPTLISGNPGASYQFNDGVSQLLGDNLVGNKGDQLFVSISEIQISANEYLVDVTYSALDVNGDPTIWVPEGATDPNGGYYNIWMPLMGFEMPFSGKSDGLATSRPVASVSGADVKLWGVDGSLTASTSANVVSLYNGEISVGAGFGTGLLDDIAGYDLQSFSYTFTVTAVPEPGSLALFGLMAISCVIRRRR